MLSYLFAAAVAVLGSDLDVPEAFPLINVTAATEEIPFCVPKTGDAQRLAAIVYIRRDQRYIRRDVIPARITNNPDCPGIGGAITAKAALGDAGVEDAIVIGIFSDLPGPAATVTAANGSRGAAHGTYLRPLLFFGVRRGP